ncbi:tetratricopeptide repeat protein [Actinoallomurus rhizosphaericola]|uniref:tetratricopeptide repeat protein n=1 Tax=Actinoallomurus rhizosphaericola TaxID=2952536 RepID=UPI002093B511|nr:tetratricopeptide repeat protein [Actinoallomurus rhizosphaericola]MCO5999801.1 tetratricopeptide repeat protein [Actinoallomurus rhizosphaericola]
MMPPAPGHRAGHKRLGRGPGDDAASAATGRSASTSNYLSDATAGAVVQARSIRDIHLHLRSAVRVTPRQLPRGPRLLVDRNDERKALDDAPADAVILLAGPGGAGKTALALSWLHHNAGRYSDGQLFADLRAYSSGGPTPPERVLGEWLRALGVAPERIPACLDERSALFRSLTAGNRFAVLADNAASTTQVMPLLPGPGCLMVVTARRLLGGLLVNGARPLTLGPLDEPACLELLDSLIGPERRGAQTAAARTLVHACGRLPLAVCLTGATLATHPDWPIARLAHGFTLPAFDTDDGAMTEIFDSAYNALPDDETRRLYRLLSHHPGPDITPEAAAILAETTVEAVIPRLEQLAQANLINETRGRFSFHDLAHDHAYTARKYEAGDDAAGAFVRCAYWYLRTAAAAQKVLIPGRWYLGRVFTEAPAIQLTDKTALEWLAAERLNLLAIANAAHQRGLHTLAWQIAEACWGLFVRRRYYDTWITLYEIGLKAARAAGDLEAQARMLQGQASAYLAMRCYDNAEALATQALGLAVDSSHRHAEATSLELIGLAELGWGDHADAHEHFDAAREIYLDLDDERGAMLMTRHEAEADLAAKNYGRAVELLTEAEAWCEVRPEESYLRSRCLVRLGRAHRLLGHHQAALDALERALEVSRAIEAHQQQAEVLVEFADLAHDMSKTDLEQRHLREAHAIYAELGAPEAAMVADRLFQETE